MSDNNVACGILFTYVVGMLWLMVVPIVFIKCLPWWTENRLLRRMLPSWKKTVLCMLIYLIVWNIYLFVGIPLFLATSQYCFGGSFDWNVLKMWIRK